MGFSWDYNDAYLCTKCLDIVVDQDGRWYCSCEDVDVVYGAADGEEVPSRWIRGKVAFMPWRENDVK
jgi:hypothetical protein